MSKSNKADKSDHIVFVSNVIPSIVQVRAIWSFKWGFALSSLFCSFRSPKIANAKTYTYPRIQLLPYVIRICILHISLRVYSLDSGADNSNYHLDKIVSNLQVLVIKTGKFTKTMSIGLLQMLFGYSFVSSTYLFYPSDRYLQLSVTLYNKSG